MHPASQRPLTPLLACLPARPPAQPPAHAPGREQPIRGSVPWLSPNQPRSAHFSTQTCVRFAPHQPASQPACVRVRYALCLPLPFLFFYLWHTTRTFTHPSECHERHARILPALQAATIPAGTPLPAPRPVAVLTLPPHPHIPPLQTIRHTYALQHFIALRRPCLLALHSLPLNLPPATDSCPRVRRLPVFPASASSLLLLLVLPSFSVLSIHSSFLLVNPRECKALAEKRPLPHGSTRPRQ